MSLQPNETESSADDHWQRVEALQALERARDQAIDTGIALDDARYETEQSVKHLKSTAVAHDRAVKLLEDALAAASGGPRVH